MKTKKITKVFAIILCLTMLFSSSVLAFAATTESEETLSVGVVEKNFVTNKVEEKVYTGTASGETSVEIIDSWIDDMERNFDVLESNISLNKSMFAETFSIIGGSDERTKVSSTRVHPYSAIVYVDIYFGTVHMRGSGFLVSDNIVVTAAHCLYSEEYGWPTSVSVMPGKTGYSVFNDPYGVAAAKSIGVSKQWLADSDSNYDWGAIEIFDSLVGNPGKLNMVSLNDSTALNTTIKISGYPAEVAGKTTYAQYEMSGTISYCTAYRYYYTIDSSGGQSGAPILNGNNEVIGIHTSGSTYYNTGIRFTADVLYYLNLCVANGVEEYD